MNLATIKLNAGFFLCIMACISPRTIFAAEAVLISQAERLQNTGEVQSKRELTVREALDLTARGQGHLRNQNFPAAYECFRTIETSRMVDEDLMAIVWYTLGKMCLKGHGVPRNEELGFRYLHNVAHQTSNNEFRALACIALAEAYQYGTGTTIDINRARIFYTQAAALPVDEGLNNPAHAALLRLDEEAKERQAQALLKIERERNRRQYEGQAKELFGKAESYYFGTETIDVDYAKANALFENIVEFDLEDNVTMAAYCYVGQIYFHGYGTPANPAKAFKCFSRLEDQEINPSAQALAWCYLGELYYTGKSVRMDREKALQYFERAAAQEINAEAQALAWDFLGLIAYTSQPADLEQARAFYMRAAFQTASQRAEARAYFHLGQMSAEHDKNVEEALTWYEKAASQDIDTENKLNACAQLIALCMDGQETLYNQNEHSLKLAHQYLMQAVDIDYNLNNEVLRNYAYAQLGALYYFGFGVLKDYAKAKAFLERAERNSVNIYAQLHACVTLGEMYYYGHGVPQNYQTAESYFRRANDKNFLRLKTRASAFLGDIYYYGYGVTMDKQKARNFYEFVVEQPTAQDHLSCFNKFAILALTYPPHRVKAYEYMKKMTTQTQNIPIQSEAWHVLGKLFAGEDETICYRNETHHTSQVRANLEKQQPRPYDIDDRVIAARLEYRKNENAQRKKDDKPLYDEQFLKSGQRYAKMMQECYEKAAAPNVDDDIRAKALFSLAQMTKDFSGDYQKVREYYNQITRLARVDTNSHIQAYRHLEEIHRDGKGNVPKNLETANVYKGKREHLEAKLRKQQTVITPNLG